MVNVWLIPGTIKATDIGIKGAKYVCLFLYVKATGVTA